MTLSTKWNTILDEIISECKEIPDLNDEKVNNGFNATNGTSSVGTLRAVQITGLTPGNFVDSFDLEINVAAGNVRVSIYGDSSNTPDQLLGESSSIPVTQNGTVNFRLQKQVEVPQDGILWLGYENDDANLDLDLSTAQASGTLYTRLHTFGSAPDPFAGSAGTAPFWVQLHFNPKVVKHYGVRGSQPENFFCVVSAKEMRINKKTTSGSNNTFLTYVDISYHGVDFQHGLTKVLDLSSSIYDAIHMTNLNGKVHNATVEVEMEEILEGDNLYLIGARVLVSCEALVLQI